MGADDQSMSNASHFNDNFNNLDGLNRGLSINQDAMHGRNKSFLPPNKNNRSVIPGNSRNSHMRKNTYSDRRLDKTGGQIMIADPSAP
jgi:hypothetical protein